MSLKFFPRRKSLPFGDAIPCKCGCGQTFRRSIENPNEEYVFDHGLKASSRRQHERLKAKRNGSK